MTHSEIIGILPFLIKAFKRGENAIDQAKTIFMGAGSQTVTEAINIVRNSRTESDGHLRYYRFDAFVNEKAEIHRIDSKLIALFVYLVHKHQQMDFGKESVQTRVILLDEVLPKKTKAGFRSYQELHKFYALIVNITLSRVEKAINHTAEESIHKERADNLLREYLPDI